MEAILSDEAGNRGLAGFHGKWKQRTCDTHKQHVAALEGLAAAGEASLSCIHTLLLGDSLFEHAKTGDALTPTGYWRDMPHYIFNAGIGGDRVENILWRCFDCDNADESKANRVGLLKGVGLSVRQIILCAGTNNFALNPPSTTDDYIAGMRELLIRCFAAQPALRRVVVTALPSRHLLDNGMVPEWRPLSLEYNSRLLALCEEVTTAAAVGGDRSVVYCDVLLTGLTDSDYYDNLHFNKKGYDYWIPVLQALAAEAEVF